MSPYSSSDPEKIFVYIKDKLKLKYMQGKITISEYESTMSEISDEEAVAEDIKQMKKEKYDELQQQFVDGELSESEFEQELDELFDSGESFLEYEEPAEPVVDRDEAAFRMREIAQIFLASIVLVGSMLSIYYTGGAAIVLLAPIAVLLGFYFLGIFR